LMSTIGVKVAIIDVDCALNAGKNGLRKVARRLNW
jgi:hypothetical protein